MRSRPTNLLPILGAAALFAATPAIAASVTPYYRGPSYANSATYNGGFGSSMGQNQLGQTGNRDANGNLLIVNGLISQAGEVAQQEAAHQSTTGMGGVGGSGGVATATAIGNNLNVQVSGRWNTVIVDSTQVNNGTQNAGAALNGQLTF